MEISRSQKEHDLSIKLINTRTQGVYPIQELLPALKTPGVYELATELAAQAFPGVEPHALVTGSVDLPERVAGAQSGQYAYELLFHDTVLTNLTPIWVKYLSTAVKLHQLVASHLKPGENL